MAVTLLYNLTGESRRRKVKAVLFRYGIPCREVPPREQGTRIRDLVAPGETGTEGDAPEGSEPFQEEMIVMHGLSPRQFHGLVDGLRAQGVRIPLKAVTTPDNLEWSGARLREELKAEAEAMASGGGTPAHPQGT